MKLYETEQVKLELIDNKIEADFMDGILEIRLNLEKLVQAMFSSGNPQHEYKNN